MEAVSFEGIEVERCIGCKGMWFAARDAEHLKKLKGSEAIDVGSSVQGRAMDRVDRIFCPVCDTPMIQMVDQDHPDLHFESCKVCYGTFFDAGEFRHYKESHIAALIRKLFGK
jgi:Zn-finger nucleic acid-binding protein